MMRQLVSYVEWRMARRQLDLFGNDDAQAELFNADEAPIAYRPDTDAVRTELLGILAEARAASVVPWDTRRTKLYRTIFPQMTLWLPADEAEQLRLEFETELKRLDAA
jgi:hypothetical protein